MQTAIFTVPEAILQEQFKAQYPIIEGLVELTIAFHKAYRDMKQEQGIMDFSDLEHLCLALLVEPGTEDDPRPSEVAKELQDTFKEIMHCQVPEVIEPSVGHSMSGTEVSVAPGAPSSELSK